MLFTDKTDFGFKQVFPPGSNNPSTQCGLTSKAGLPPQTQGHGWWKELLTKKEKNNSHACFPWEPGIPRHQNGHPRKHILYVLV